MKVNMNKILKNKKLLRFALFAYAMIWLVDVIVYAILYFKFYQINWTRYDMDSNYHKWVEDRVLPLGIARITGNQTGIHDFWLALPFLLGGILSVLVFVIFWKSYVGRTFMPLFAVIGYVFPFLQMGNENLIIRLLISLFFVLLGSITTIFSTRAFGRG
ncbi:MAG: hypothetical protein LBI13_06800 [Streptococcaceae bacterium]|jgi:hypothetical protein|nr:hypothetical protein [Streptococcaceae bacterium]